MLSDPTRLHCRLMESRMRTAREDLGAMIYPVRSDSDRFQSQLIVLLDYTNRERKASIAGLQPLFKDWQLVKASSQASLM